MPSTQTMTCLLAPMKNWARNLAPILTRQAVPLQTRLLSRDLAAAAHSDHNDLCQAFGSLQHLTAYMGNHAAVHSTIQNCSIRFQAAYPNISARSPIHSSRGSGTCILLRLGMKLLLSMWAHNTCDPIRRSHAQGFTENTPTRVCNTNPELT